MVQVSDSVGTAQKGSMKAVSGSGMASMSEASMLFQPRMEEPSKPKPSSKTSSVNSRDGTAEVLPGAEGIDELDVDHLGALLSWPIQLRSWVCSCFASDGLSVV